MPQPQTQPKPKPKPQTEALIYGCVHAALGPVYFRFDPPLTRAQYREWKLAHGLTLYPWEQTASDRRTVIADAAGTKPAPASRKPEPVADFAGQVRAAARQFMSALNDDAPPLRGRKE